MYDVIIIGGGLAGCSAAIQLAERGRRVLLLEKRVLPAHKLCGEFLSTEVMALFRRLGVLEAAEAAGAHRIRHVRATTSNGAVYEGDLPGTALGLSRYRLDQILFQRAAASGADARDGTEVRGVEGTLDEGFTVTTRADPYEGRVVLGAYGKRGLLDRKLGRSFLNDASPLVAFKAHYEGARLPGLIELHSFPGGYAGLSHVEEGRANLCWIGEARLLKAAGSTPEAMIERSLTQNESLAARLHSMRRVSESFLAVSQVSLARKPAFEQDVCMIGDTAGMIAPLCGDGMAMALRSAELAAPHVEAFLQGGPAGAFREGYAAAWKQAFCLRVRLGRWMHRSYLRPAVAGAVVRACRWTPGLGRWLICQTRG